MIKTVKADSSKGEISSAIGVLFQAQKAKSSKEEWDKVKKVGVDYIKEHPHRFSDIFFYQIVMPCGESLTLLTPQEFMDLPIKDIPCPCGNPKHWLIKYNEGG